jgi:hypothetical protein
MSMEIHGGMLMSTEENSCFFHQSSVAILPAESSNSVTKKPITMISAYHVGKIKTKRGQEKKNQYQFWATIQIWEKLI